VNQFESAALIAGFRELGCAITANAAQADVVVINTCAVTARASQQSRQSVRRIARENPTARIVVTGCQAEADAAELRSLVPGRRLTVVGNAAKHLAVQAALADEQDGLPLLPDIGKAETICPLPLVRRFSGRTRSYLRIQDGCNNFCAYCIVPHTRGRSRSLPLADALAQAAIFVEEGCKEIIVTGINVGKYGLDLREGMDICSLLERLCREFPQMRIRLSSVEPTEVSGRLLDLLAAHGNFMPHLHIPLQSGDSGVLARMNRRYTAETFAAAVEKIHAALPHAAIGCDILAGFPGEDEEAAARSLALLDSLPLAYLHVFPYSARPGTAAAAFPDHVSAEVKEARVAQLRVLDQRKREDFIRRHLGTEQLVLLERKDKRGGPLKGFSENYIPVRFGGPASFAGQVVRLRLLELRNGAAAGELPR
jgi:threonylcarbamoyladenosine tRNA methylthiotransferase MtaB